LQIKSSLGINVLIFIAIFTGVTTFPSSVFAVDELVERISKQQLEKIFAVDRITNKYYGLPMITINSHSKFVRESDLRNWETNRIKNHLVKGG